jgi:GT2 family glycosyltransferase
MKDVRLCIVILNWNSCKDTLQAIESLTGCEWAITVVDNASSNPQEAETIRRVHPDVTVLQTIKNLGYAGGMNVGLKWAAANGFTHAVLLNPDTLPTITVIESMIRLSAGYAVVGTAQVTEDLIPYVSAAHLQGRKPVPFMCESACGEGHDVDVVSGAAILVELNIAEQLNFIDEEFFHYKEEFDYCYRVGLSGGKLRYSCGAALIHRRGGSLPGASPMAVYYSYRNELLFLRKHFGRFGWLSGLGIFRNALQTLLESPDVSFAVLKGLSHGLRGISGPTASLKSAGGLN